MLKEYYGGLWLLENSYLTHTHTSFKLGFPRLRKVLPCNPLQLQQLLAMHISDSKYTVGSGKFHSVHRTMAEYLQSLSVL